MAVAPKMPPDEALDILHRLEPVLLHQTEILDAVQTEQRRQSAELVKVQVELGELRGRLSQLPTWWQMLASIVAIFAAALGLLKLGR